MTNDELTQRNRLGGGRKNGVRLPRGLTGPVGYGPNINPEHVRSAPCRAHGNKSTRKQDGNNMECIPVTFSSVHNPTVTIERMLTPAELEGTYLTGWQHEATTVLKWDGGQRVLQHHYVKDCGQVRAKYITRHNMFNIAKGNPPNARAHRPDHQRPRC